MSTDDGPGTREVARRLFAAEFEDATLSYSEGEEERAPNYVVTPTGTRVNRLFAVGVLTEVEQVNEDSLRGRVVDPTGPFVTYAGQYQPDENAFLGRADPPMFVALAGKARTFEPEDSDRVFTSARPESLNEVDAETRDRWVVSAAERTLDRIAVFAAALDSDYRGDVLQEALERQDVGASLATGIPKAIEHYGTGTGYLEALRNVAVEAVEQVAGEREAVSSLDAEPGEAAAAELGPLPDADVSLEAVEPEAVSTEPSTDEVEPGLGDDEAAAGEDEAEAEPGEEAVEAVEEATESAEEKVLPGGEESADETPETTTGDESGEAEPDDAEAERATEPDGAEAEPAAAPAVEPTAADTDELGESEPDESAGADPDESGSKSAEEAGSGEQETEPDAAPADEGEPGDFDDGESVQETVEQEAEELGDFDPSETVDEEADALTEEERKEVEDEFGTEFATGTEVSEPGEADIDVPTADEDLETEPEGDSDAGEEPTEEDEAAAAADSDLESVVVDTMDAMDAGDGVPREEVIAAVVDEHGADADIVDDAIQEAMMSGKCYEPSEGTLKAI